MIIIPSFFLILLILVAVAWFVIPLYIFGSELCKDIPEKSRNVLIQVPEKVQIHTEFRLDDTVIGKEAL